MSAPDLTIDAAVLANVQATVAIDLQDQLIEATLHGDPGDVNALSAALGVAVDRLAVLRANASGCACTEPEPDDVNHCLICRKAVNR
jgi:hypothetical protein